MPSSRARTYGSPSSRPSWLPPRESYVGSSTILNYHSNTDNHPHPSVQIRSLNLEAIHRFQSTASAVEDITAIQDGRLSDTLKNFLSESIPSSSSSNGESSKKSKKSKSSSLEQKLIVSDPKLAGTISKALSIPVHSDTSSGLQDLYRGIRTQLSALLGGVQETDLGTMRLGLGHSLSR